MNAAIFLDHHDCAPNDVPEPFILELKLLAIRCIELKNHIQLCNMMLDSNKSFLDTPKLEFVPSLSCCTYAKASATGEVDGHRGDYIRDQIRRRLAPSL